MTRRIRTAALAVAATLLVAITLSAHTKAVKTLPAADATVAAPTTVQVWFNETPDVAVSKLTLEGPSGAVKLGRSVRVCPSVSRAVSPNGEAQRV